MEPPSEARAVVGPPAASLSEPRGPAQGARILVAEDNPINATVAVKMLEKRGHRVDLARDGRRAVEMLGSGDYEAVLMDCQMPELDGYEAAAEIRRGEGPDRRIPIIAMTAHAMAGDREKCIAAGMDDYLSKPIRSEALHEALRRWVRPQGESACGPSSPGAPEPGPEDDVPLVDHAIVEELRAAGAEALAAIVDLFVREASSLVAAIRDGVSTGDAPGVAENAHLLKGGSASVGAARMAALAGRLENLGRAATLAEAPPFVEALASTLEPSTAALREAIGSSEVQAASARPAA
ncbi:MAG: response regulator [Thermoleophilaceae bacterium]